ncbi:hypothetical protein IU459_23820 [Nocardia amamiensis]|uniref:Uncharacterized protein n=1 Tax=Nocardia amamiensis TaxID=404578 RepID=A0ABS0CVB4_9NOCA|nr:hypothetical protein [Nocardia amamiensis]MBF6300549.1 hypothetical protein [Nocardia amamiensis]
MSEPVPDVTVADTVRWLHDEGLVRLAGVAESMPETIVAYTIDVATGTVTAHPATGGGVGADAVSLAADDLPYPVGTAKRLVIAGVTTTDTVLVIDLAATLAIAINADHPEQAARSWVMQLLLNPEITITTNSGDVAIGTSARLRQSFIPGGGATLVNIDDTRPPVTAVTLNATTDGPDHLDVAADGTGEMYLGARFWQLRQVMRIEDAAWSALAARLDATADDAGYAISPEPAERL